MVSSEALVSLLGFATLVELARILGPVGFSDVEFALAVAAWLLVLVRGGFDVIVAREAARRPALVSPLTDLLIGLRLVAAAIGFVLAVGIGAIVGPPRREAVWVAGLVLFGSAGSADLWPRALGRLGWVGLGPVVRGFVYLLGILWFVREPRDAPRAVACLALAEAMAALATCLVHRRVVGPVFPRWRRRASLAVARRGIDAGLIRFGRVTLLGLDLLAMGWLIGEDVGEYAAARRLVFAVAGLAMVLPSTLGPSIARAWSAGREPSTARIAGIAEGLWALTLPAALGLMWTADRTLPFLFGSGYAEGGPWLAIVAARLPWMLSSILAQTALIACRREAECLRLVCWQTGLGVLGMALGVWRSGPLGAGLVALAIELGGSVVGWRMLARIGVGARAGLPSFRPALASLAVVPACLLSQGMAVPWTWLAGALAYGVAWWSLGRMRLR